MPNSSNSFLAATALSMMDLAERPSSSVGLPNQIARGSLAQPVELDEYPAAEPRSADIIHPRRAVGEFDLAEGGDARTRGKGETKK
jgi:hypothetical protein